MGNCLFVKFKKGLPQAIFPDLNGKSAIFDIGGSSKATGIGKYDGLADIVESIIY